MKTLGIDPGTRRCGWGVVERVGSSLRPIDYDVIVLRERDPLELRLRALHQALAEVIATHRPEAVAVEDVFFAKYANAGLKLGHARGVALLAAANAELAVHSYPPALVKRTVGGSGRASKEQLARMVGVLLGLREEPGLDATDALAIAITHCQSHRLLPAQRPLRTHKSRR